MVTVAVAAATTTTVTPTTATGATPAATGATTSCAYRCTWGAFGTLSKSVFPIFRPLSESRSLVNHVWKLRSEKIPHSIARKILENLGP